jgi:BolA family transcriptional regulator, general stress-responsive regulator
VSDQITMIRERLESEFSPAQLEIEDQSAAHAGHAGARNGGHFAVHLRSDAFVGKTVIQRHRMVYDALGDLMQSEIHALAIKAETIDESNQEGKKS